MGLSQTHTSPPPLPEGRDPNAPGLMAGWPLPNLTWVSWNGPSVQPVCFVTMLPCRACVASLGQ